MRLKGGLNQSGWGDPRKAILSRVRVVDTSISCGDEKGAGENRTSENSKKIKWSFGKELYIDNKGPIEGGNKRKR
jgi:hypothetical protein